jgi:catechol 2,3-dioxygenase-like lactoylglutathione lyase family enzyme
MPIKVTRMFHAAVNTAGKQQECHEFYTNFLGLPEVPVDLPGLSVAPTDLPIFWLEKQGVQLHVIASPRNEDPIDPVGNHVSWYVEDIDAAVAEVESRGLPMKAMGEGRRRIVWIQDPAGNTMELQQDPDC